MCARALPLHLVFSRLVRLEGVAADLPGDGVERDVVLVQVHLSAGIAVDPDGDGVVLIRGQGVRGHAAGLCDGYIERAVLNAVMTGRVDEDAARNEKDHEQADDDEGASSA